MSKKTKIILIVIGIVLIIAAVVFIALMATGSLSGAFGHGAGDGSKNKCILKLFSMIK